MLWQKEELIMTFRMYAGVRFNREISTETDAITVGGYEMYLIVACHFIQEPCGSPFCFPCGMGIYIHCGTHVRVS